MQRVRMTPPFDSAGSGTNNGAAFIAKCPERHRELRPLLPACWYRLHKTGRAISIASGTSLWSGPSQISGNLLYRPCTLAMAYLPETKLGDRAHLRGEMLVGEAQCQTLRRTAAPHEIGPQQ